MNIKHPLYVLLLVGFIIPLQAQHPLLYFSQSDTSELRAVWRDQSAAFPQAVFKELLSRNRWEGDIAPPSRPDEWADYDRAKASKAKALAFRFMMEQDIVDGDMAFDYLLTKYAADNYLYQADNYARWMTNGLALIDYCAAFDFLAGADYFNPARHTGPDQHDIVWWNAQQSAVIQNLHDKAAAIFSRVKNARTGSDAFSAQLFGNQTILNEVNFHAQVGNHRIIVASALGVAAYALKQYYPQSETGAWLGYAVTDVEQFLLNRVRYAPLTDKHLGVASQNVEGAFPEGMEYLNYSGQGTLRSTDRQASGSRITEC